MQTVNNFQITGFVVNNAQVNQFATATVARFGIAVGRIEKYNDQERRVSAILNMEAWKTNEDVASLLILEKGKRVSVSGFFKPEEWIDKEGVKHNTVKLIATNIEEFVSDEPTATEEAPAEDVAPKARKGKKAE